MILEVILRWHAREETYKKVQFGVKFLNCVVKECEGFPGCDTKIRKKDNDEKSSNSFTYDLFKSICYKWQVRLTKVTLDVLSYILHNFFF